MKWTPKSISNGNNKWALPCTAGIGFVIENEMKGFVFIFLPFTADYSVVLTPAAIFTDAQRDLG